MIELLALAGTLLIAVMLLTIVGVMLVRRNRDRLRGSGAVGNALQEIEGLFVESKQQVLQAERAEEAEEETDAGDPPVK